MHKPTSGDSPTEALSLIQTNGIRGKGHPIGLAIQNGTLPPGLTAKNGTIYKQQAQVSGRFFFPWTTQEILTSSTASEVLLS